MPVMNAASLTLAGLTLPPTHLCVSYAYSVIHKHMRTLLFPLGCHNTAGGGIDLVGMALMTAPLLQHVAAHTLGVTTVHWGALFHTSTAYER